MHLGENIQVVEFLEPGSRLSYSIFILSVFISYLYSLNIVGVHPVFILVAPNTRRLIRLDVFQNVF